MQKRVLDETNSNKFKVISLSPKKKTGDLSKLASQNNNYSQQENCMNMFNEKLSMVYFQKPFAQIATFNKDQIKVLYPKKTTEVKTKRKKIDVTKFVSQINKLGGNRTVDRNIISNISMKPIQKQEVAEEQIHFQH